MTISEKQIERQLILDSAKKGYILFKNEVGFAFTQNGFPVHYGLCKGSSDLIGWKTITITPDMVGMNKAIFCAVEVKKNKHGSYRATREQQAFIDAVNKAGGYAVIADCIEDIE